MKTLTQSPEWQALSGHYQEITKLHLRDLFQSEPQRFEKFSIEAADLLLDYSKNYINETTIQLLCQLAETQQLGQQIEAMFSGKHINISENRPALHTALRNRNQQSLLINNQNIMLDIQAMLKKMEAFVTQIHTGQWRGFDNQVITDVVNIGIGGSDLGPLMATEALAPYKTSTLNFHFVSNIDGALITPILKKLNPATTLFVVSSKSFSTTETIINAQTSLNWFKQATNNQDAITKHFVAITSQPDKAIAFGIAKENIFQLWEWVGGRYSLWSTIGLPIALAIGMDNFYDLLAGADAMDQHFKSAPFHKNMPVLLGLLGIWYINFFSISAHAILPYTDSLKYFPAYLQQLEMESNGKRNQQNHQPIEYMTCPIIFGAVGLNAQHAFYQLLHQGTRLVPADFIVPMRSHYPVNQHHAIAVASAFSQSKVLMEGKPANEPHKALPGNRPSNIISFSQLTPHTLGALIALYEHKVFVQSVIWQVNAFDQWSVEHGKQLANIILQDLIEEKTNASYDSSTNNLIKFYHRMQKTSEK